MTHPIELRKRAARIEWRAIFRKPRPSVRLRLTALYGSLFVLAGGGVVAVTNLLVRVLAPSRFYVEVPAITALLKGVRPQQRRSAIQGSISISNGIRTNFVHIPTGAGAPSPQTLANRAVHIVITNAIVQQNSDQHALLLWSIVGFAVMAVVSVVLAWWLAGRALRPLRQITATANAISATNLHERLGLAGPDDELKGLAATFNRLLGRLEVAFEAQRRFVANASHELRSPLARQRAVAEVALSDPNATVRSLRESYERVIAAGEEEERLIASLLLLARSDRGIERKSPVDLDEIVRRTVASLTAEAGEKEVQVAASLDAALIMGDPELVERLVVNLVANAIEHNRRGGFVKITTNANARGTCLKIENSGAIVGPNDVERLMRPFERTGGARTKHNGRFGLGLSIVDTIARAHDAPLSVRARDEGGLEVTVEFPVRPSPDAPAARPDSPPLSE